MRQSPANRRGVYSYLLGMGLYMSTRMSLFEVFCLVATVILLWAEFSQPIQYPVDGALLTESTALQGKQATQNINPLSRIRPPPL